MSILVANSSPIISVVLFAAVTTEETVKVPIVIEYVSFKSKDSDTVSVGINLTELYVKCVLETVFGEP